MSLLYSPPSFPLLTSPLPPFSSLLSLPSFLFPPFSSLFHFLLSSPFLPPCQTRWSAVCHQLHQLQHRLRERGPAMAVSIVCPHIKCESYPRPSTHHHPFPPTSLQWSFTYIPACYEAVSYTPPPPPTPPLRGRTYSTVVGASMEDSLIRTTPPSLELPKDINTTDKQI